MKFESKHQPYILPVIECVSFLPGALMQGSEMSSDDIDSPSFGDIDW